MTPTPALRLVLLDERLAVCRLSADADVPAWVPRGGAIVAVVRTREELSILAPDDAIPELPRVERGWRALMVRGPLAFHLVGVLASIAQPLAEAAVTIFAVSTFDTDYVLVKDADLPRARAALERAGHVIDAAPSPARAEA